MRFIAATLCFAVSVYLGIAPGHAERRVALVIGNADYQSTAALPNPANDAQDMAAALKEVGFEVIVETNVSKRALETALARFGRLSQNADASLFYYAGHGVQYRGRNYLVPVDARLEDEFSVNYELTRIDDVGNRHLLSSGCGRCGPRHGWQAVPGAFDMYDGRVLSQYPGNRFASVGPG
jgi:hypothetical protein